MLHFLPSKCSLLEINDQVAVALDLSQDVKYPDDLWMSLQKSSEDKMGCNPSGKVRNGECPP